MRYAVVGDPVAHSLSPVLHTAAYDALGLAATYEAHRVPAGGLAAHVGGLGPAWRGLSVTMPLKREAYALADDVDGPAALSGGVNTLVLDRAGGSVRCHGHNTDVPGAVAAMAERGVSPATVTVLGGGATAASLALAACDLGAGRVRLAVRDPARAADTAAAVRAHPTAPRVEVVYLDPTAVGGDLVVSTVPAAVQTPDLVASCLAALAPGGVVFEARYDPWPTPLAAAADAVGTTVLGGLDLLVHQAALQHALFTGHAAPLEVMRAAGAGALARRPVSP